jgi:hypothetical protein
VRFEVDELNKASEEEINEATIFPENIEPDAIDSIRR